MLSTRRNKLQNGSLLSQLGDFDRDVFVGSAVSGDMQKVENKDCQVDRDFTVNIFDRMALTYQNTLDVLTLEKKLTDKNDEEMGSVTGTVEYEIKRVNLTAMHKITTPRFELAVRSINGLSGQDVASVNTNSERGEQVGISAIIGKRE